LGFLVGGGGGGGGGGGSPPPPTPLYEIHDIVAVEKQDWILESGGRDVHVGADELVVRQELHAKAKGLAGCADGPRHLPVHGVVRLDSICRGDSRIDGLHRANELAMEIRHVLGDDDGEGALHAILVIGRGNEFLRHLFLHALTKQQWTTSFTKYL
jgi:hypothetical protein